MPVLDYVFCEIKTLHDALNKAYLEDLGRSLILEKNRDLQPIERITSDELSHSYDFYTRRAEKYNFGMQLLELLGENIRANLVKAADAAANAADAAEEGANQKSVEWQAQQEIIKEVLQ